MDYKGLSRPLDIKDVDFRVQSINNGGYATILAYKDARVDMNRLDEVVGPSKWKKDYRVINEQLFCGVSIFDVDTKEWVTKWDVGTESFTEAEKGQASDAFKRACFNWGIGRELYDYPFISIRLLDNEWSKESGRPKQTYHLKIRDWEWYSEFTDGKLTFLAARDQNNNVRYQFGKMKKAKEVKKDEDANVKGLLKKKSDKSLDEDVLDTLEKNGGIVILPDDGKAEREVLAAEYKKLFGKAPHGRMGIEKMKEAIQKMIDSIDDASEETNVGIAQYIEDIEKILDPVVFVNWAKGRLMENMDDSAEDIQRFKDKCNEHYAQINR